MARTVEELAAQYGFGKDHDAVRLARTYAAERLREAADRYEAMSKDRPMSESRIYQLEYVSLVLHRMAEAEERGESDGN